MAAGSTYTPIATTTLGSNASSVTFSSLGSYTDIVIVVSSACTADDNSVWLRFNSDSGTNYSVTQLRGSGTSAISQRSSNISQLLAAKDACPTTTLGQHTLVCNVMNYSNSSTYKTVIARAGTAIAQTYNGTEANVGLWRNTSAITSITVGVGGSFITGSTFTLYGIVAA